MAEHLAIGENFQPYSVYFAGVKVVKTPFTKSFNQPPHIDAKADDSAIVFKDSVTKDVFTLRCKQPFTGTVTVFAVARS